MLFGKKVSYYVKLEKVNSIIIGVEDEYYKLSNGEYFHAITKSHRDNNVEISKLIF